MMKRPPCSWHILRAWRDRRAIAAVEFALLAPMFCLMLAAAADFGGVLYTKFCLESAVSAASNYALLNASSVSSTGGAGLASKLAAIIAGAHVTGWANGTIVVDNGPTATANSGTIVASGTASNADLCYCPTGSGANISWGSSQACSTTCASGGLAGKFVQIVATRTYTPMFSAFGIVKNGAITASAVAETK
jgi:Flp pilus assembly protein TadG